MPPRMSPDSDDIEDPSRPQKTLRESERQRREVLERNLAMHFMVDATGTILSVNAFGASQLGYASTNWSNNAC